MSRWTVLLVGAMCAQEPRRETVVVTGTFEPVAIEEFDRAVRVVRVPELELVSNTLADFLKLDSSLDLRQRAPNGLQSDLSIRGGTFGQTLVLVDGARMNDAQSGHHNLDVPLPLEAIERIEVLRGSGSTWYGSDAVGGVVNIITRRPESSEFRLRTAAGNFGVNQQRGSLAAARGKLTQQLTFSRDFSSGFRPNRDYRNLSLASTTHLATALGSTGVTLAYNDRPFGADQFYGNFNSWENTKTWLASLRQGLGANTDASFTFRRHSDLFVLYRDRPEVFANHHAAESFQASVRRRQELSATARLNYGIEGYRDSIVSNNLGSHSRARGAAYASVDVRSLRRFSFSLGAREEIYRSLIRSFSPSASAGVWLSQRVKLRGSASRAFRLPSYTDLYYHDPANQGSPDLRPESAWSYEGGVDWNAGGKLRGEATLFHRRETDGIDYVRRSPADIWRATNFQKLRFTGVEISARARGLDLSYTGLRAAQDALQGVFSRYVFNFPAHSGVASWTGSWRGLIARTRIGAMARRARDPYAVWDVYAAHSGGRVRPFVQFTNLTATTYQEILGVAMPGRAVVGGIEVAVFGARR
ncbi:MAG: TonB-dependent receptor plug domain-containing protein, partial [Bryobacteraceae bacterium]